MRRLGGEGTILSHREPVEGKVGLVSDLPLFLPERNSDLTCQLKMCLWCIPLHPEEEALGPEHGVWSLVFFQHLHWPAPCGCSVISLSCRCRSGEELRWPHGSSLSRGFFPSCPAPLEPGLRLCLCQRYRPCTVALNVLVFSPRR